MAYDVFISFKNTAPGGGLTVDRTIAERLHIMLHNEGLSVFFSEKDLSTTAFMNEIYRALEEAPLLILIGSSVDYIKSKWVMSEWQNFLGAMNIGKKPDGQIMTVLSGIANRDLPIELANFQSYDADNLDGAVDFAFKALGRVRKSEAAAWLAQEEARKRREAEEAAVLEAQKRLEMERQAEREKAAAERERQRRINAENRANKAQKSSRSMKIVAAVLAMVLIFCAGLFAWQMSAQEKIYDFLRSTDGYMISWYNGDEENVELPSKHNGKPINAIGVAAFHNCTRLTSVSIPDSVTSIGDSAFYGCSSLTSITLPDSVTHIGYRAFEGCTLTVYASHEASYYDYTPSDGVTWVVE